MNTTMAPFEQNTRHASVAVFEREERRRRDGVKPREMEIDSTDESKREDGGNGGGGSGSEGDGGGGSGSEGDGDRSMRETGSDGSEMDDGSSPTMKGSSPSPNPEPLPSQHPYMGSSPTTVVSTTTAPAMTMTVVVTATPSSVTSFKSSASKSLLGALAIPTYTSTPLFSSTSSSPVSTITVYEALPDPCSQARKGVDADEWSTTIPSAEAALSSETPGSMHNSTNMSKGPDKLSPLAQDFLIAAGAIGAFIMVSTAIWFFLRMRKIDLLASIRTNRSDGNQGRYYTEPPPQYSGMYASEKAAAQKLQRTESQRTGSFDSSTNMIAMPALARDNSQRSQHSQRQEMSYGLPIQDPSTFTQTQASMQQASVTQTFYNIGEPMNNLSRQGTQTSQLSAAQSYNINNTGTQQSFQTSGLYDPNQREVNHLSYLSSISSGFGDGLIMPEPTVVGAGDTRQSYRNTRKFSWMTAQDGSRIDTGNRDTVYTTASIEAPPRFRTVNSWVAQQSDRVGRQEQSDKELPSMPEIPLPLQNNNLPLQNNNTPLHTRNQSEDPAFRHHPGDELSFGRGSRVPSSILDRKVDVNRT